jgi:hypothetical protein
MWMRIVLTDGSIPLINVVPKDLHKYVIIMRLATIDDIYKIISQASCVIYYGSLLGFSLLKKRFPELMRKPSCPDESISINDGDVVIVYHPHLGYVILEYHLFTSFSYFCY